MSPSHRSNLAFHFSFKKACALAAASPWVSIDERVCETFQCDHEAWAGGDPSRDGEYAVDALARLCSLAAARLGRDLDFRARSVKARLSALLQHSFNPLRLCYDIRGDSLDQLIMAAPWAFSEDPLCRSATRALQDFAFWAEERSIPTRYHLHAAVLDEEIPMLLERGLLRLSPGASLDTPETGLHIRAAATVAVRHCARTTRVGDHRVLAMICAPSQGNLAAE